MYIYLYMEYNIENCHQYISIMFIFIFDIDRLYLNFNLNAYYTKYK